MLDCTHEYNKVFYDHKTDQFRFVQCEATLDGKPKVYYIYQDEHLAGKWKNTKFCKHWVYLGIL